MPAAWENIRSSPRDWRVLRWIRRKPHPVRVIGETAEGEEVVVAIGSTGGAVKWADATRALHECSSMRALDASGATIRVLDLPRDDPELITEAEKEESVTSGATLNATPGGVPLISVDVPRLVTSIAQNMQAVAAASAQQQANAFRDGFAAMVSVVNLCLSLLTRIDKRLEAAEEVEAEAEAEASNTPLALAALGKALANGSGGSSGDLSSLIGSLPPEVLAQVGAAIMNKGSGNAQ